MLHPIIIIYGVSGCGKSTIGSELAKHQKFAFFDADDYHPAVNKAKMAAGQPLTDDDRWPWLKTLAHVIHTRAMTQGVVLACSALKESYRRALLAGQSNVSWVLLNGDFNTIEQRLHSRSGHFMKSGLLKSQFDTLEIPSYGLQLDVSQSRDSILQTIRQHLQLHD